MKRFIFSVLGVLAVICYGYWAVMFAAHAFGMAAQPDPGDGYCFCAFSLTAISMISWTCDRIAE